MNSLISNLPCVGILPTYFQAKEHPAKLPIAINYYTLINLKQPALSKA